MENKQEVPLIYTAIGNVPIDSLKREDGWVFTMTGITYWEKYLDEKGTVVKESAAKYILPTGTEFNIKQGEVLNG